MSHKGADGTTTSGSHHLLGRAAFTWVSQGQHRECICLHLFSQSSMIKVIVSVLGLHSFQNPVLSSSNLLFRQKRDLQWAQGNSFVIFVPLSGTPDFCCLYLRPPTISAAFHMSIFDPLSRVFKPYPRLLRASHTQCVHC